VNKGIDVDWHDAGLAPLPPTPGVPVHVIGVGGQPDRPSARAAIRVALVETLSAGLGVSADRVAIHTAPGEPPYATVDCDGTVERIGLSISHDDALSVAALRRGGAVGIDLMRVVEVPDCYDVARDYLGPGVAAALARLPLHARAEAFARAWSAHEARLKCLGLGLVEWDAQLGRAAAGSATLPLRLPSGYVGFVALPAFGAVIPQEPVERRGLN
jgi:4'-phosphopantetheinyl transferase